MTINPRTSQTGTARKAHLSLRAASIIVFGLLLFTYSYIHQTDGYNQNSRLDLLHAFFERGEVTIDAYHQNTGDKALIDGHYYSEKAPGITFLAIPAFVAARTFLMQQGLSIETPRGWWLSDWMTTVGSVGLLTAAGGAALFVFLARRTSRKAALITTLVLFLGAAPIAYATALFSHGAVVGLLCIALWLLDKKTSSHWTFVLAGLCAGLVTASEFTAAPAAIGLFIWSVSKGWKAGVQFTLGAIAPLLLIPAYNWAVLGSPFLFGYKVSAAFGEIHRQGFFGISFPPSLGKLYFFLFSPMRGLFFWTPFLLLIIAGYATLKRHCSRPIFLLSIALPLIQVILIAGFHSWGGSALGPRYLASILPFLALPVAFGWERYPRAGTVLAFLSILLTGLGTAINAMPHLRYTSPLTQLYLPSLRDGTFAPTIASELGITGIASIAPLIVVLGVGIVVLWRGWATKET